MASMYAGDKEHPISVLEPTDEELVQTESLLKVLDEEDAYETDEGLQLRYLKRKIYFLHQSASDGIYSINNLNMAERSRSYIHAKFSYKACLVCVICLHDCLSVTVVTGFVT